MRTRITKTFLALGLTILGSLAYSSAYKELIIRNIDGKPVRLIKVVLDGEHFVVTSLAENGGDTLENLTKKVGGDTSLNGVFFCPDDYSYCDGVTHTIFERVFKGDGDKYSEYRPDTGIRGIFGFDQNGDPLFVHNNVSQMEGLNIDINRDKIYDIYFGLSNFPVLLAYGEDVVRGAETQIDEKMSGHGNKHIICSTSDKKTIYMGVVGGINVYELPAYLKENFDCYFALNLDAGYSSAMIYDGDVLQRSNRRRIMDAFVVLDKEQYEKLTGYPAPKKEAYTPPPSYKITLQDKLYIDSIVSICRKFIDKYGDDLKRGAIKLFRLMLDSPKYESLKDQTIIHNILVQLYKVDEL